jgi:hypothetical protein
LIVVNFNFIFCKNNFWKEIMVDPVTQPNKTKFPFWLKIFGSVCFLGALLALVFHQSFSELNSVVEGQLSVLRTKKITEAYYAYSSQEFQANTSFENFKEFIKANPIFLNNTSAVIQDKTLDSDKGRVNLTLYIGQEKEADIVYDLIKENDSWKILKIQLQGKESFSSEDSSTTEALLAPIKTQLKAFQKHDTLGAYKDLVSKKFQKTLPFDKFKIFVLQHSILNEFNNFDFKRHSIEGHQGSATVILNSLKEIVAVRYNLIEENQHWKIADMRISSQDGKTQLKDSEDTAKMISILEQILSLFKVKEYDKVYQQYIADNIKKETTLEAFKKFVKNYSAFSSHESINIKEPLIEDGIGHVVVDLNNEEGITSVEFSLKLFDSEWKVEGIHVEKSTDANEEATKNEDGKRYRSRELLGVIQSFLKSVRENEEEKAYQQYTSENFKKLNTFQDFQSFLKAHSELTTSSSYSFEKLMFNNSIATFAGKLFISEKFSLPLEFDLIQEENRWKILNIFIYPLIENSQQSDSDDKEAKGVAVPLEFKRMLLGTQVDEEGHIENPTTNFHKDSGDINMNLFITHGVTGTKIEIVMRHIDSGSEIPPVNATLNDNGDNDLSFVFSPPPHGWPKGSYQIRVSSSTQVFKTFPFTVD